MHTSQIMSQSKLMKNCSTSSCPPGFEPKDKHQNNSITVNGDGENNNNVSIVTDGDVFETQTEDSKLTDSTASVKVQVPYQPQHPLNTPYSNCEVQPPFSISPYFNNAPQISSPPPQILPTYQNYPAVNPYASYMHVRDTMLTSNPTQSLVQEPPVTVQEQLLYYPNQLVPLSIQSIPNDFQDPYSRNDNGQFNDYNYIRQFNKMVIKDSEKNSSPQNKTSNNFNKSRREWPEKSNSRISTTNSDSLFSPRSTSSHLALRPTSQGSQRSTNSQNSLKLYRSGGLVTSPRYSEQNLYIAGFSQEYNLDNLKPDIIKIVNDFGDGLKIVEADFNVQVKESNKPVTSSPRLMTYPYSPDDNDFEDDKSENSSRTPSQKYAFLDFEEKVLASKVLSVLRDPVCKEQLELTYGRNFSCRQAKKQNQDMTNVFFKGQPEIFRNEDEYRNSENGRNANTFPNPPKIHSYNEQEIVLTAIHIYLLSAGSHDSKNQNFDDAVWFGENELKKVVSLRIQSDSKTKPSDNNPGLICLIRYKHEDDAKKIIEIFGGTIDRNDASNQPKKFLDAKPNVSGFCCLSELPAEPLITVIKKLKEIDWPMFGDNSENGKKISKVGEKAWEKAVQFCNDGIYKQIVGEFDLVEVKYANTQQEKRGKSPEKGESIMWGDKSFSPKSSYRSFYTPVNYRRHSTPSQFTPRPSSHYGKYSWKEKNGSDRSYNRRAPGRSNNFNNWRRQTDVKPSQSETIPTTNPSPISDFTKIKALAISEVQPRRYYKEVNVEKTGTYKLNSFRKNQQERQRRKDKELDSESDANESEENV